MLQIYLKNYNICEYVKFGGNIVKIWYFANNCLIEARIKNSFAHVWNI